jgi:hypothetical protein
VAYHIDVDFEVMKKIWAERDEGESDGAVIRRLLKMPAKKDGMAPRPDEFGSGGRSWTWKGVTLPPGTRLRMDYLGQGFEKEVRDGALWIGGRAYTTPSGLAKGVARTRQGKRASLDGWRYLFVKRPTDQDWVAIDDLRPKTRSPFGEER